MTAQQHTDESSTSSRLLQATASEEEREKRKTSEDLGADYELEQQQQQRGTRRRRLVDWIQKQKVPRILRRYNNRDTMLPLKGAASSTDTVYFVSGLDRVLFGTVAAADAVLIAGVQPPRYLWYMLSGAICDVIQFSIDIFLHNALNFQDASVCWALGFMCSIVFRHTSHRYFVFGDYVGGYWHSLARMYAGYSVIIVLSTLFNILMTRVATLSHYLAWILTLLWTGVANYFILKRIWTFGGTSSTNKANPSPTCNVEVDGRGK